MANSLLYIAGLFSCFAPSFPLLATLSGGVLIGSLLLCLASALLVPQSVTNAKRPAIRAGKRVPNPINEFHGRRATPLFTQP